MKKICVVGSINMDYFAITDVVPVAGETVIGNNFISLPGGKGANQAIAAARLGGSVSFIGALGNDVIAKEQSNNFRNNDIDTSGIIHVDATSGVAQITVNDGENRIIVIPGANGLVSKEVIDQNIQIIKNSDIILLQMEIPLETVEYTIREAKRLKKVVVLNPAPWVEMDRELLMSVDYLTPNEIEAKQIFGENINLAMRNNPNKLIITQGSKGVMFFDGEEVVTVPSVKTRVVDTTGAGDTFNGALVYSLANNLNLKEAVKFANEVASIAISKLGAQSAMPTILEYREIFD